MNRQFSVKEIETLCQIVKKEKYKGDPSDLDAYKAYLGRLHYKELLTQKNLKLKLEKLQQTCIAGDAQKKAELEPKIELLRNALDAGTVEMDGSDRKNCLKKIVSVDFALLKNKNLSAEEQVLKLNESVFYAFTVSELTAACVSEGGWTVTFDPEFLTSLCGIFAGNEEAYMSVMDKLQKSAGSYEATEAYYQRAAAALADDRAVEKEKRRMNQPNADELLNDIETRLMKCMDSCTDPEEKFAMLLAVYHPECVVMLCGNRDMQNLDKVTIEDAAAFISSIEHSSKYGLKAGTIRDIAPYVNVELKDAAPSSNIYNTDVKELLNQQMKEKEREKNEDLKKLKEMLPYFTRAKASREERKGLFVPPKAEVGCGAFLGALIVSGGLTLGLIYELAIISENAHNHSNIDVFCEFVLEHVFGGNLETFSYTLLFAPTIIFTVIILSILGRSVNRKNKERDKLIAYIAELEKTEQEQQQLATRAAEGILPENMRNYDAVCKLISMLEYKRAASLGEAMNILEMQKVGGRL